MTTTPWAVRVNEKKMQDEFWPESVTLEMLLFCKSNTFVQYLPT